jgi:hypothetical protein
LLQGAGALIGGALLSSGAGASKVKNHPHRDSPFGPTSEWLNEENARTGDGTWMSGPAAPAGAIEGYTNVTSVNIGRELSVFASSSSPHFTAKIYRMGYYQGLGARLVETKRNLPGRLQLTPPPDQYGTVDCQWPTSFTIDTDRRYSPGQYLIRLELPNGQYSFVPFVVRDDTSTATYAYMSAVTTWQAYNTWGGFSLYRGADRLGVMNFNNAQRAVRVSFNRPYDRNFANGAADFIGNEFPLLFLAERHSLDLAYMTDLDLDQRGDLLVRHRALLSLGHDEYYSPAMRDAITGAVAAGVNVAFFGANFCYRKIRFEESANGPDRLMVNYRSTADPVNLTNPSLTTVNWSDWPSDLPESTFSGSRYGGVDGTGSLVVADSSSWLWRGTGLVDGDVLKGALGGEFNRYDPASVNPSDVQILGHSPVGGGLSDVTYVAAAGRGGVFSTGTGQWIYHLSNAPLLGTTWIPGSLPLVTAHLTKATENVLALFGQGPAGNTSPSVSNVASFY